jgi:hypothetical protein
MSRHPYRPINHREYSANHHASDLRPHIAGLGRHTGQHVAASLPSRVYTIWDSTSPSNSLLAQAHIGISGNLKECRRHLTAAAYSATNSL